MKGYETPIINIKEFSRSIVTEESGTNTTDAVNAMSQKANGGMTSISFGDLRFAL